MQSYNPIDHVVLIIKQNHTFDNYFGTFPGANGVTLPQAPDPPPSDPPHDHTAWLKRETSAVREQYTETDIPAYFAYARQFTLCDNYFTEVASQSEPNHLMLIAADSPIIDNSAANRTYQPPAPFDIPSLPATLQNAGLDWRAYGDQFSYFNNIVALKGSSRILSWTHFDTDVAAGTLANVSWLYAPNSPTDLSEHPPFGTSTGQPTVKLGAQWTADRVNQIAKSKLWASTVIFITWAEWGGWYDHVDPPPHDTWKGGGPSGGTSYTNTQFSYGPRVGCLVISPYAKKGYISRAFHSHVSLLKFCEKTFGLAPLNARDASSDDMADCFDFSQKLDLSVSPFLTAPGFNVSRFLAVSGFSADTRTERDLVGIGTEVDAFAYLISAKALEPPLAIGLFGDWGSGKSFFMQSLQKRIHKITEDAVASHKKQQDISVFKSIVQIEFNAWHYVEGELWASLVEHIFHNLQTHPDEEPSLQQQRQQALLDKLANARKGQKEAQALKIDLESLKTDKEKQIKDLEQERSDKLEELNKLKAEDVLGAIQLTEEQKKELNQRLSDLGTTKILASAAEFTAALDELSTTLARGNALTTPLRERGWRWAVALIVVLLSGPVISLLLTWFAQAQISAVTNALVSISVLLSGLTAMIKLGTARLSDMVLRAEKAQALLDAERRRAEADYAQRLAQKESEYAELQVRYDQAKREEQAIQDQIDALEQELAQITPRRVLLDFIRARAGSEDYSKRLGIAALIRRDFEQLSQLIKKDNEDFIKNDNGNDAIDPTLVNRIVLYIDDLDRCPPERVVEVLQAVHLLLAFPLFVVVVAVDMHWLSQSLEKHYEDLLVSMPNNGQKSLGWYAPKATPQDYVEKIFQVPFWVRPLTDPARVRIVNGLLQSSLVREKGSAEKSVAPSEAPTEQTVVEEVTRDESKLVQWSPQELQRPWIEEAMTDSTPPSLDILPAELDFMASLKELLGETPRSVKRFVNLYRLLKAIALSQTADFTAEPTVTTDAKYRQVLFLLAILTGTPSITRDVFSLIDSLSRNQTAETHNTLEQLLKHLRAGVMNRGKPTQPATQASQTAANEVAVVHEAEPAWQEADALRELEKLEAWVKTYDKGSWLKLDARRLATWVPEVARFSFRKEEGWRRPDSLQREFRKGRKKA